MLLRGAKGRIHLFTIKSYICEFIEFISSCISFGDLPLGLEKVTIKCYPDFFFILITRKINLKACVFRQFDDFFAIKSYQIKPLLL